MCGVKSRDIFHVSSARAARARQSTEVMFTSPCFNDHDMANEACISRKNGRSRWNEHNVDRCHVSPCSLEINAELLFAHIFYNPGALRVQVMSTAHNRAVTTSVLGDFSCTCTPCDAPSAAVRRRQLRRTTSADRESSRRHRQVSQVCRAAARLSSSVGC